MCGSRAFARIFTRCAHPLRVHASPLRRRGRSVGVGGADLCVALAPHSHLPLRRRIRQCDWRLRSRPVYAEDSAQDASGVRALACNRARWRREAVQRSETLAIACGPSRIARREHWSISVTTARNAVPRATRHVVRSSIEARVRRRAGFMYLYVWSWVDVRALAPGRSCSCGCALWRTCSCTWGRRGRSAGAASPLWRNASCMSRLDVIHNVINLAGDWGVRSAFRVRHACVRAARAAALRGSAPARRAVRGAPPGVRTARHGRARFTAPTGLPARPRERGRGSVLDLPPSASCVAAAPSRPPGAPAPARREPRRWDLGEPISTTARGDIARGLGSAAREPGCRVSFPHMSILAAITRKDISHGRVNDVTISRGYVARGRPSETRRTHASSS